ncbi:hypothetical protein [Parvibium lacunae]|uniref:Uncharacterized protein n=1 Tax=Parvibium lacunae TaxID=1888893 RepID=A0A368KZB8_9BURK|nr:hypothetical protein [Parvibium lacunae]RCS56424.1 hypothetical protein DU000_12530 [Parvibium lacunae]
MNITKKTGAVVAIIGFLVIWLGVPTFNKWRADKLVDELCAKDGGVKVYETVTLPKERFNQWGQFEVFDQRFMKPSDEYYTVWETKKIKGDPDSEEIWKLTIYQDHFFLYRAIDKKLLGEAIGYVRRGGDPINPFMPSSHACPSATDNDLSKQIFLKSSNQ